MSPQGAGFGANIAPRLQLHRRKVSRARAAQLSFLQLGWQNGAVHGTSTAALAARHPAGRQETEMRPAPGRPAEIPSRRRGWAASFPRL